MCIQVLKIYFQNCNSYDMKQWKLFLNIYVLIVFSDYTMLIQENIKKVKYKFCGPFSETQNISDLFYKN